MVGQRGVKTWGFFSPDMFVFMEETQQQLKPTVLSKAFWWGKPGNGECSQKIKGKDQKTQEEETLQDPKKGKLTARGACRDFERQDTSEPESLWDPGSSLLNIPQGSSDKEKLKERQSPGSD